MRMSVTWPLITLIIAMGLKDEVVALNDPEQLEEAAEEEEEDLVDPMDNIKAECQETSHCTKYKSLMDACTERVEGGSKENCIVELHDFVHCVDHCVSQKLFSVLK